MHRLTFAVALAGPLSALVVPAGALAASTAIIVTQTSGGTIVDQTSATAQSSAGAVTDGSYTAIAGFGVLKTFAGQMAPLYTSPDPGFVENGLSVTARFTDVVTVAVPVGVTSGSFIGAINVTGVLTPNASVSPGGNLGVASMQIIVKLPDLGQTVFSLSNTVSDFNGGGGFSVGSLNGSRYFGPFTGLFSFAIPFETLVGQTIEVSLACGASGRNTSIGQTAGGTCAFDHSLYWGGISGAIDQNGDPIAGFGLTSQSGLDFGVATPVPEPAGWAMLITGFGLIGALARRRRARMAAIAG